VRQRSSEAAAEINRGRVQRSTEAEFNKRQRSLEAEKLEAEIARDDQETEN
jgi:hypothetical protein